MQVDLFVNLIITFFTSLHFKIVSKVRRLLAEERELGLGLLLSRVHVQHLQGQGKLQNHLLLQLVLVRHLHLLLCILLIL